MGAMRILSKQERNPRAESEMVAWWDSAIGICPNMSLTKV